MENKAIASFLKTKFINQSYIQTSEINKCLSELFPEVSTNTIAWRLNQLKEDKLIFQSGRGVYTFHFKPSYLPELSLKTKRVYNKIKGVSKEPICIWDTLMINDLSNMNLENHWIFVVTNKKNLEPLFDNLLDFSKQVFLNPDPEIINRYLLPQKEAIILLPLITEAPLYQDGDYMSFQLEGLLVNAWFKYEEYLKPIGFNIDKLFAEALNKYNINFNKMLRYASRRDKRIQIENLIKKVSQ